MCEYKLRAHHGLCTLFFVGKGYSNDFTRNMADITEGLQAAGARITLCDSEDDICTACPNNKKGCISSQKVKLYDRRVLELCGLIAGQNIPAQEFYAIVNENILSRGRLAEVCGDCQWFGLCSDIYKYR